MPILTAFDRETILTQGQRLAYDAISRYSARSMNSDYSQHRFRVGEDLVSWHLVELLAHFYLFTEQLCDEEKNNLLEIVAISINFLKEPGIQSPSRFKFEGLYDRANYHAKIAELRDEVAEIVQEKNPFLVDDFGQVIHQQHPENLPLDREISALEHLQSFLLNQE